MARPRVRRGERWPGSCARWAWWERSTSLAGPLALRLAALPAEESRALRARGIEAARPYAAAGGVAMPGLSLVGAGRAPSGAGA